MSRRFRFYSWLVSISDLLIGSVFFTAHPAMESQAVWFYVLLIIPWWAWSVIFLGVGLGLGVAIGTGKSSNVRKVACIGVVALMVWATDYALLLPSIIKGANISWMGLILVSTIAGLELLYLGMPASKWLDDVEDAKPFPPKARLGR